MGRLVCDWPVLTEQVNGVVIDVIDKLGTAKKGVQLTRHAAGAFAGAATAYQAYVPAKGTYPTVGVELNNDTNRVLDFKVRFRNAAGKSIAYGGSVKPTGGRLQLVTLSKKATTDDTGWDFAGNAAITSVRIEQWDTGPSGAWGAADKLTCGDVYADIKGKARFFFSFDDVPANAVRRTPLTASTPVSGRSTLEMLAYHGHPAIFYIVPGLVGGAATNITQQEVLAIQKAGHLIGSHSSSHPIDATGAGLRLLGSYGYRRSRLAGNGFGECRITSASAATGVLSCESDHKMSVGGKVVFIDTAPTGFQVGTTYWVTGPAGANMKLASSAGNANAGIGLPVPADWAGVAEWRWPGSADDDTAILADIRAGIDGLRALGVTGHEDYFALPQGGWDHQVRSAVERLGIRHTRGISSPLAKHRSIHLGWPTGGSASSTPGLLACGFPQQQDAFTSDQGATQAELQAYIDEGIEHGYTMFNYHHSMLDSTAVLDWLMGYVAIKRAAGLLETPSLEEMAVHTRLW